MPATIFDFTNGIVTGDRNPDDGVSSAQATQKIGGDTLTMVVSGSSSAVLVGDFFGSSIEHIDGDSLYVTSDNSSRLNISLDSGKSFDFSSINIFDSINASSDVIFIKSKGSLSLSFEFTGGGAEIPFTDEIFQGVTWVEISRVVGGADGLVLDDIQLANIMLPNTAPTFVGGGSTLTASQNGASFAAGALLNVSDTDSSQTLTWTQFAAPSHGTLNITGAAATSGGANITPGGIITYTPMAGFAGVDTFTVQVSDGVSTATRIISVNVGPTTPGTPDLATASDSGNSNGIGVTTDNITNAATLNFSGTSAAGDSSSTVRVFLDTNNNGVYDAGIDSTATATVANGAWTVTGLSTNGVSDGDYNIYAQVTSATGGLTSTVSSALMVTIDKTPPGQTLTGLSLSADTGSSGSDFVTKTAAQTVSATLSGVLAGDDVLYGSLDGGATWTDITSKVTGTSVTWNGVTLSEGSNSLQLKVVDAAGNGGAVASQGYTLDTARPAAPSTPNMTLGTDTGASNSDAVTSNTTPVFTGTAEAGAAVTLYDTNGTTVLGTAIATGGNWSITSATLAEGDHTLTAKATDLAGNVSDVSDSMAVIIDTTGPTLAITSDASAVRPGGDATITFTFSEAPADFGLSDIAATGGTLGNFTATVSPLVYTVTFAANPTEGPASIAVAAGSYTDQAGNLPATGSHLALTIDGTSPTLTITSNVSTLKAGESATITFTFSEAPVGFTSEDIAVSGGTLSNLAGSGLTYTATFTPIAGAEGTASIDVEAGDYTDQAGNLSATGSHLALTFDGTSPTLAITSNVSTLKAGESATITFSFSEAPVGFTSEDIAVSGGTLSNLAGSGLTYTATFTPAAAGEGTASVSVAAGSYTDLAGNNGGGGILSNLHFDTLAPNAPSIPTLTSASDSGVPGDGRTTVNTPTLTGTSEAGATVRLYDTDGTTVLGSAVADGWGVWTIVSSQLSIGAHTLTAKATDLAGNVSSAGSPTTITIDASTPQPEPEPEPEPEPGLITVVTPTGNQVTGDVHDNLITPSSGADTVSAGGGDDTVQGGASHDVLQGNVGNDSIAAGGGSDLVYGGQDEDFLNGNVGEDSLYGDKGQDTLHGGQGNDFLQGGQGNDYVSGDLGDDVLHGGQGDDLVFGGAGNDYLSGGLGSDTLTGGTGADTFHSFGGAGLDLITDFNRAEGDRILLDRGTSYTTTQVAGDVHIDMVGGGQVILAGVQLSTLSGDWIIA